MGRTITGEFGNRRDAEMSVERLVQERGIERTSIFIAAVGAGNTAGEMPAGADAQDGHGGADSGGAPQLGGPILVSVDLDDEGAAGGVREALSEYGALALSER